MRVRFWGTRGSIRVALTVADIRDKLAQALVHDPDPRRDLDMASYGVVKMLPGGPDGLGTGYQGLGWEPKLAFGGLAQADWRAAPGPVDPVQGGEPR